MDDDAKGHGQEFEGFEWDDDKSERNLLERGYDYDFASRVFDSAYMEDEQLRGRDRGELRYIVVGEVDGFVLQVVWTPRGRCRRIVSSRPAKRREAARYHGYCKALRRTTEE